MVGTAQEHRANIGCFNSKQCSCQWKQRASGRDRLKYQAKQKPTFSGVMKILLIILKLLVVVSPFLLHHNTQVISGAGAIKSDFTNVLDIPKTPDTASPVTPISPVKKHSSMEKPCLDALVQILASRPLSSSLPKSLLSGSLPSPAFTPELAVEHAEQIFHAVLEATSLVKPSNRSEVVKLEAVWGGVAKMFSEATTVDKLSTTGIIMFNY